MALILGIESTCDETGVAVVDGRRVLSNAVASQVEMHADYGGVVPEIASRAHIENLWPTLEAGVREAGVSLDAIDAVAVAHRPGLIGSLVVGLTAAKTLAFSLNKPLVGVDHVHAHLHSVLLDNAEDVPLPAVGLVASGGHSSLYLIRDWDAIAPLGKTIDDAVGEAYDKVAAMLGLGYPGGPIIDLRAADGDAERWRFPRPTLKKESLDFSFSGLKTAVLYGVFGRNGRERTVADLSEQDVSDACASFQAAAVDTLRIKLRRALQRTGAKAVVIGGGVSANRGLRAAIDRLGVPAYRPPLAYCTDNAAMIAGLGGLLFERGRRDALSLDAATLVTL